MSDQPDQSPEVDFDHLLDSVDPDFTKSLEDLHHIENSSVDIPSGDHLDLDHDHDAAGDDELPDLTATPPAGASFAARLKFRLFNLLAFLVFALRRGLESLKVAFHEFKNLSNGRKGLALLMIVVFAAGAYLAMDNLRGTWLPGLTAPVIGRLEPYADHVDVLSKEAAEEMVSLTAAFPPDVHEFLFRRFKVNLRPTADNPQPMGAFEFVVSVDTKETAIEARDREVEFADFVQRIFEEQTFNDLATELGKAQLKSRIQGALNEKLSAGRVSAVNFKTFILKP